MRFLVKNWSVFQHYKDRSPPWIKLQKSLLDDARFNRLSPLAGKSLVLLWLLASESMVGELPSNPDEIAFRLRISKEDAELILTELFDSGFLIEAEHAEQTADGKTVAQQISEKNGFGSRHISDKTKREVWMRDNGVCVECQSPENIEYDHIHPISKGGNSNLENVQLLCRPCNRKKRAKTAEQLATPAQPWLNLRTTEAEAEAEADIPSANAEGVGSKLPPCPHQEIIALYHEALPACTAVREWTPARQALLRSRWAENEKRQTLDWWRRFFGYVAESEFLTGRGSCGPDRDPFVADLEWLVRPKNFVKVIEGKYHKGAA